jgi:hypothetical protein
VSVGELRLIPDRRHPGRNIDPYRQPLCQGQVLNGAALGSALEDSENAVGDETATHGENVAVTMPMLMGAEEALGCTRCRWPYQSLPTGQSYSLPGRQQNWFHTASIPPQGPSFMVELQKTR